MLVVVQILFAQSAAAVEYTDSTSAESKTHHECPGYGTKQSDGEAPVMLEIWGRRSTISLLPLPDPLWSGVVEPYRILSKGQVELNAYLC